ncbi:TonB-dependent receptor [Oceanicoccus sagamiensis]|uniref:TonB-dependent receptor n=1 Tax=Oceanicoccus sagamiensis TaxID=716816 RepID=A0A1X9NMD7_9GAMM|nr:TonB-dependent receptor [Oceanicoccus sagamiensis]ARN75967.1 hypothetical protein BST96_18825 [Oceanicoccus sagamiensis]
MNNKTPSVSPVPFRRKVLSVVISSAILGIQASHAQVLEEVIVTSTKQLQNIQDIPQAITAFTTEDIERRGFVDIDDYAKAIPSLSFSRREPGGTSVVFRGVAASGIQFNTNPSSSVYLDEQPVTSAGVNPNPRMIDIERLEALSGPQGTLFGDASQSGALRIITNKPNTGQFEAWVEVGGAYVEHSDDYDTDISAMVNIPISENVALRLVGFSSEEAGYVDNVLGSSQPDAYLQNRIDGGFDVGTPFDNAKQVDKDVNSGSAYGGRANLRIEPNDDWIIDLTAIFQNTESDGFSDTDFNAGSLEQIRFNEETSEDEWYQLGINLEGDLGFAETVVSLSYFDRDWRYDADATDYLFAFDQIYDPTYVSYYGYTTSIYDFNGTPRANAFNAEKDERWSFEARLAFEDQDEGRWNAIVGTFYNKTEKETSFGSLVDGYGDTPAAYYLNYTTYTPSLNNLPAGSWYGTTNDTWFFGEYDQTIEDLGVFGEGNYDVTEKFTVTLGGRWYKNEREFSILQGSLQQAGTPSFDTDYISNIGDTESDETGFVPKVSVKYQVDDDKLVYGTYSEGFRSGGGNAVRPSSVIDNGYDSDYLINYELGAKTTWLNNALRFNVIVYHMIWEDIQIQVEDPQVDVFSTGIVNFPEAEIDGIEFDIAWAAAERLELSMNYAYVDAAISEDATIFEDTGTALEVSEGTQLPITPDHKGAFSAEYFFAQPILGGDVYARLDYAYVGKSVNSLSGFGATSFISEPTEQESYETIDLKLGYDNDDWSASLYVKNLTDEEVTLYASDRWVKQRRSVNKPMSVGFSIRRNFD